MSALKLRLIGVQSADILRNIENNAQRVGIAASYARRTAVAQLYRLALVLIFGNAACILGVGSEFDVELGQGRVYALRRALVLRAYLRRAEALPVIRNAVVVFELGIVEAVACHYVKLRHRRALFKIAAVLTRAKSAQHSAAKQH